MADGFSVETDQIRSHARSIEAQRDRLGAVKAASAHIAQDDAAYGLLCGWISGVLEGRHAEQDELIAGVERNLSLIAERLRSVADEYENTDQEAAGLLGQAAGWLD